MWKINSTYCVCKLHMFKGTSVLSPAIPAALVFLPGIVLAVFSKEHIYQENPIIFILTFGLMFAKITNKLIVSACQLNKRECAYTDAWRDFDFDSINSSLGTYSNRFSRTKDIHERVILTLLELKVIDSES